MNERVVLLFGDVSFVAIFPQSCFRLFIIICCFCLPSAKAIVANDLLFVSIMLFIVRMDKKICDVVVLIGELHCVVLNIIFLFFFSW